MTYDREILQSLKHENQTIIIYTHYHNSNLIWRTVSRRVDEVIQWYGLIHET